MCIFKVKERHLPSVVELFFLLLNAPVDFLSDLAQLKLGTEDLVLLLLEGGLSLFESGLKFFLLDLEAFALLFDLVDVATAFADLVHEVLDFVGEVLVLAADGVQLFEVLLVGGLHAEQFGGVVAALLLGGVQLSGEVIHLHLPFGDDLVEVLLFLLGSVGEGLGAFHFNLHVLQLGLDALLGLLQAHVLHVELFDLLFGFVETSGQFETSGFELLSAGNTFLFVLGAPHLRVSVRLGKLALKVALGLSLFLELFAKAINVVLKIAEFAEESGAFLIEKKKILRSNPTRQSHFHSN